ncbi:hypothetical protein CYMTET_30240 [Cymbomonas tetramitiformis]|uniref:VWFD domain-containing protein n=1 Tax=Cymbomonas tetramitiformis TaxID=36881 RepID=A0AAE0KUC3_9CHLO|nr:hypothetical protein CYMTET_30240 [Cymbomonas tetramitiformis]
MTLYDRKPFAAEVSLDLTFKPSSSSRPKTLQRDQKGRIARYRVIRCFNHALYPWRYRGNMVLARNLVISINIGQPPGLTATPSHTVPPPYCLSSGDPHFRTFSGRRFDFHGKGEFVLVNITQPASQMVQIHACQDSAAPRWWRAAANTKLAVLTNDFNLTVTPQLSGGHVTVTSYPSVDAVSGLSVVQTSSTWRWRTYFRTTITLPSSLQITVQPFSDGISKVFLHVALELATPNAARGNVFSTQGLCGPAAFDSNAYNVNDNSAYDSATLFRAWKVPHAQSLYRSGATYNADTGLYEETNLCTGDSYLTDPCRDDEGVFQTETVLQGIALAGINRTYAQAQCDAVCEEMRENCLCDAMVMGDLVAAVNASLDACGMEDTMDEDGCVRSGVCTIMPTSPPITRVPTMTRAPTGSPSTHSPSTSSPIKSMPPTITPSNSPTNTPTKAPSHTVPPPYCLSSGDPHFRTFSGRRFDFHGKGEFVLVNITQPAPQMVQIHACQDSAAPRWWRAAANTKLAVLTNDFNLTVTPQLSGGHVTVTSYPSVDAVSGLSVVQTSSTWRWRTYFRTTITLPSSLQITVQPFSDGISKVFLHVALELATPNAARGNVFSTQGLCGPAAFDSNAYNVNDNSAYDSATLFRAWKP